MEIQDKLKDFERLGNNRLERAKQFLFDVRQAKILLQKNAPNEFPTFLKNVGSNWMVQNQTCRYEAKPGWRALVQTAPNPTWRWRFPEL